jgi:hypothetical protein
MTPRYVLADHLYPYTTSSIVSQYRAVTCIHPHESEKAVGEGKPFPQAQRRIIANCTHTAFNVQESAFHVLELLE